MRFSWVARYPGSPKLKITRSNPPTEARSREIDGRRSRTNGALSHMALRVARGLFRLWIVGAALFVIAVAAISYSEIKNQFNDIAIQAVLDERKVEHIVPQLCGEARGVAGTDYATNYAAGPGPWDTYAKPNFFDNCWYKMSKFRPLYPEYKDVSDKELSRKLYADHGVPVRDLPNPWVTLGTWASIAVGIPLVVLILGSALIWAFRGFR